MYTDEKGLPTNTTKSDVKLTAYNNTEIYQYGTIEIPCKHKNSSWQKTLFYVAETDNPVIYGLPTCKALGIVIMNCGISKERQTIKSLDDLKKIYPDRFTGLGQLPGKHKLIIKEDAQPIIHPPRRAPIQLRDKIKQELNRMTDLGVIRPVTEATDWVSSITYVRKPDGSLRICLDPKDINKALKRGQHHTPTVEELTHRFTGARVFSKLDAKSGYWCVQLDDQSQLLTTFNSPFGRFCFQRLPFGLKTSQDTFQKAMDDVLQDLPGIVSIADDITVYGSDDQVHDKNLHLLMERAREKGLVFNPNKCFIRKTEIPFFGNIYSATGVRPDPAKVQAITDLLPPKDKTELQSFLGMITYLSSYISNLSDKTTPLRQLLHKDVDFQWHQEHQKAFTELKQTIQTAGTLSYFNPSKPTVLQVDASQQALGAVLTQDGKPICFASKSLTNTEKNYANIERELLAAVFAAERFHTYIYGKEFVIESVHRPLEMITKKTLTAAPARLQRMLLRLQRYDYRIIYKPGKEMLLADSLSRLPKSKEGDTEIPLNIHISFVQFSTERLMELREHTSKDSELLLLTDLIKSGFPEKQKDIHTSIRKYWSCRDELSLENGLVIKGEQVVIPQTLHELYLGYIHEGHLGITRCQQRARMSIYWPGINKDIEDLITKCHLCQTHQASQKKEPLDPVVYPCIPWNTISMDLLMHESDTYLIVGDYYSKYVLLEKLSKDTSSSAITKIVSKMFSCFGYPSTVITDNGPQFIGQMFQTFLRGKGIAHITSSPHHAKSHGFIERLVRTVKNLIKKSADLDSALLAYHTSPLGPQQPSPGELFFGRKLQHNLPAYVKVTNSDFNQWQNKNLETTKAHYDNTSDNLPELHVGESIFFQDIAKKTWSPGVITGIGPEPKSYTILCSLTGRYLRRNRIHIRRRKVKFDLDLDLNISPQRSVSHEPSQDQTHQTQATVDNSKTSPPTIVSPEKPSIKEKNPVSKSNIKSTRSGRIINPPEKLNLYLNLE